MKYADLLGDWLLELGYSHCFFVAGGGIMHLLDAFRNRFECIPVVHEVTAGISAEHFNQCISNDKRAFALVTTGPGITNIVTAIAGCYAEHRELLVIAGQVKSSDLLIYPERQRGVQEVDGAAICHPITVHSECLTSPITKSKFQSIVNLSKNPHPGPVLLEVCLDVQGALVDKDLLTRDISPVKKITNKNFDNDIKDILKLITQSSRPLILLGGLVDRAVAWSAVSIFEALGVPVATTTSAIDRVPTSSPIFAGRPGTWGGQRAGNLILAQADLVLVLGAQLDLQQTGFNYLEYAPQAKLVHVFPSQVELDRVGPPAIKKVLASPNQFLNSIIDRINWKDLEGWGKYVRRLRELIPALEKANLGNSDYINSFEFLRNLSIATDSSDVLALCSSGGTFTGASQSYEIAPMQVATNSPAHASMGYGLATAIGASFTDKNRCVVLTEGEGGFSQNLQELAVISRYSLPIKIFIIDNGGYGSIRATQKKFFGGAYLGCDPDTGLGFPDWEKLFGAYEIPCRYLEKNEIGEEPLRLLLQNRKSPEAWIVRIDPDQTNWPNVSTVLSKDGKMSSSPLYDMLPRLPEELLSQVGLYLPRK